MKRLLDLQVPVCAMLFDDNLTHLSDPARLDICDGFWKTRETVNLILEQFAEVTEIFIIISFSSCYKEGLYSNSPTILSFFLRCLGRLPMAILVD